MNSSNNAKVGGTVILGLVILSVLIFTVSNYHIFESGKTFFVTFSFANGLTIGAPVMVAGVEVGNVESNDFIPDSSNDGNVRVRLTVWVTNQALVYRNSKAFINTLGLMGEKYLEITTGTGNEEVLGEGETLIGSDPIRQDQLLAIGSDLVREFQRSIAAVNAILDQEGTRSDISNTLHNLNNITERLNFMLEHNQEDISTGIKNFSEASVTLNNSMSNLDRMVTNNEKTLTTTIEDFQSTLTEIQETISENRPAFNAAIGDFQTFSHTMAKISENNRENIGTTIANVEASSTELRTALTQLNTTLQNLNKSEGALGMLLNDRTVANNLRQSSTDIRELVDYVKYRPWLLFREDNQPLPANTYD